MNNNNHGGIRAGSGRKARAERLSNYDKALTLLNNNIEASLKILIDGLKDTDKSHKLRCAELLLKKAVPDLKSSDLNISSDRSIDVNFRDAEPDLSKLSVDELNAVKKAQQILERVTPEDEDGK